MRIEVTRLLDGALKQRMKAYGVEISRVTTERVPGEDAAVEDAYAKWLPVLSTHGPLPHTAAYFDANADMLRAKIIILTHNYHLDEVMIFYPGESPHTADVAEKNIAGHSTRAHIIFVFNKIWFRYGRTERVDQLAHEILHHFLEDTIRPNTDDPKHDDEGIMHPDYGGQAKGIEGKLGCKTVAALKRLGVEEIDIDQEYVIQRKR